MLVLEEMPADVPEPRVHANQDQWNLIARELYDRHLVEPVGKPVELRGKPLVNGAFAVVKPNRFLEDERAIEIDNGFPGDQCRTLQLAKVPGVA